MRRYGLSNTGFQSIKFYPLPEHLSGYAPSLRADEQKVRITAVQQGRATALKIPTYSSPSDLSHRYGSFLRPLSHNNEEPTFKVYVLQPKPDEFAYAEPRSIEKLKHGLVSESDRRCHVGLGKERIDISC